MITFGKKVSTRPIVLGLLYGGIVGLAFSDLLSTMWATVVGIAMFCLITLFYYGGNLPFLFNAWSINDQEITYYDMTSIWKRIKLIFLRDHVQHDVIKLEDITDIKAYGVDIPMHATDLFSWGLPVSPATGIYSSAITRIRNPKYILVELKDGKAVRLDMSRDFAYNSQESTEKFNRVVELINKTLS